MNSPCTPGELERLMAFLAPVNPNRRPEIARLIFEEVDRCPSCDHTVRRCDARRRVGSRVRHLDCGRRGVA